MSHRRTPPFLRLTRPWQRCVPTPVRRRIQAIGARFDEKLDQRMAELRTEIVAMRAEMRSEMNAQKADLIEWIFLFFTGYALASLPL